MEVLKNRKPTLKQEKFAKAYIATGGNGTQSAKLAGYGAITDNCFHAIASENLQKPTVISIIRQETQDLNVRFKEEAHKAFQVILNIIENDQISPHARLLACKDLLDRAGYKPTDKTELSGEVQLSTAHTRSIAERARGILAQSVNNTVCDK
jgi:hypothetical protein